MLPSRGRNSDLASNAQGWNEACQGDGGRGPDHAQRSLSDRAGKRQGYLWVLASVQSLVLIRELVRRYSDDEGAAGCGQPAGNYPREHFVGSQRILPPPEDPRLIVSPTGCIETMLHGGRGGCHVNQSTGFFKNCVTWFFLEGGRLRSACARTAHSTKNHRASRQVKVRG